MRIALITEKYTPDIGGLAISAERFARLLCAAGAQVHVFAPTSSLPSGEKRTFLSEGISLTRFGARKRVDDTLVDWFELLIEEHGLQPFDLIHAYFLTHAGFVAAYAGRFLNLPSVVTARGNDVDRAVFEPSSAAHILYALEHANAVTTNTCELARKAAALRPGLDVTVIPNGVDSDRFRRLPRSADLAASLTLLNAGGGEQASGVIGFAGELREKKGLRPLLGAYAQINRKRPATLLIIGDIRAGEDQRTVEDFRLAHPEERMVVTGYISPADLPVYYSLIDVFVQPSLRDGLPNSLLEAMACEKAVIGAMAGGIVDAITDDVNGRLVPANNVKDLTQAIEELLENRVLRERFGTAARQTVQEKFTPQAELSGNLEVYQRLGLKV